MDDRIFNLKKGDYIGRDIRSCEIAHPEDIYLSGKHAQIEEVDKKMYLDDASRNGIFIRLS